VNLKNNETGNDVLKVYNITAFPTKILISPEGKIVGTYIGAIVVELDDKLKEIFGE
jgi:hypothetical protein